MLIDTHAHLDMKQFDKDRGAVLERAAGGGISHIVTVGIDLNSSRKALSLAHENRSVYAAVGYHPHNAGGNVSKNLDVLAGMTSDPKVVAWGEIGLDFFRGYASREDQLGIFAPQLAMAFELSLPVIIHDREAHSEVLRILKKMGKGEMRGVVHCFSGDMDLAMALIELGYFISIPGTVTYKKALETKEVAARIPLARLLIETDAPFLGPVPKRGKRNEPLFVTYTAREIARLRNMDLEEVARATSKNAMALFGLE
ncbi:MAG: TatD family hydrolase [Deltaproteobacteria bacterium]|nr:TatD family hydrolase [Deltaproteobacteria bacterium]